jgi:hypothetical protein
MKVGLCPLHSSRKAGSTKEKIGVQCSHFRLPPPILDNYNSNESDRAFCACIRHLPTSAPIFLVLQPFVGPWPLFSFLILYTVGRTPWTRDQLVARPLPKRRTAQTQKNTYTHHKHRCSKWDSNPRSQRPSERRQFIP